jgi:PTH2 family peptidyl-tRNA hydrolase
VNVSAQKEHDDMPVEPNPFDDEKLIQIRESQEDPIVQYYIVRTDVPMSVGKVCAQIAHGAQMFAFTYIERYEQYIAEFGSNYHLTNSNLNQLHSKLELTNKWKNGSFRKVVLGGKTKDFERIKKELDVFLVRDAGLTEVESGTETVLVTWPILKSTQPKFLQRLRVLDALSEKLLTKEVTKQTQDELREEVLSYDFTPERLKQ